MHVVRHAHLGPGDLALVPAQGLVSLQYDYRDHRDVVVVVHVLAWPGSLAAGG